MYRFPQFSALVLTTVLALASPSSAQLRPVLVVGAEITRRMLYGHSDERYRHQDYGFLAIAGQQLEFTMRSDEFDAYLLVVEEGAPYRVLVIADTGGEGTNARLRFRPSRTGRYVLRARNFSGDRGGEYTISMTELAQPIRERRKGVS